MASETFYTSLLNRMTQIMLRHGLFTKTSKTLWDYLMMQQPDVIRRELVTVAVIYAAHNFSPTASIVSTVRFWGLYRKPDGILVPMLSRAVREDINREFARLMELAHGR